MGPQSKGGSIGGRLGYLPLSANLVHQSTVAEHWKTYCRAASEAGLPEPDRNIWCVARSIYIGESNNEAWDLCRNGAFGRSFAYLLHLLRSNKMLQMVKHDKDVPDDEVTVEYVLKNLCIIGDKKTCLHQLEELWDITGGFGTLLMIKHDFDDIAKWKRCMEVLANEVVPALPEAKPAGIR